MTTIEATADVQRRIAERDALERCRARALTLAVIEGLFGTWWRWCSEVISMSDSTPADVIAAAFSVGRGVTNSPEALAARVLDALATAGYRVTPIPDDNTRAEVLNLVNRAKDRRTAHSVKKRYAIADDFDHVDLSRLERMADLLAAAYLDGQPQDRPATCPNPHCHDGWVLDCDECREKGLTMSQTDCSASGCRVCGGPLRGDQ